MLSLNSLLCLLLTQVVNKAVAAELIFVATTNFDKALYTEGCDVEHLLEGLGNKGITRLFHNLSILAWAVVIAKVRAADTRQCLRCIVHLGDYVLWMFATVFLYELPPGC
eukprot:GHUV01037140.1.p1 GENE.GHUV01037140.1~~GHUV01037140.1.p1  ORF type:complete len:110 (+),score=24.83 GHUV01037140.1:791-1120(+)